LLDIHLLQWYYVYQEVYVMRTNIVIDELLISKAMEISELKTKKEIVNLALQEYVNNRTRLNLLDLKGHIEFSDGYDPKALREGRPVDLG